MSRAEPDPIPFPTGRWWSWIGPGAVIASLTIGAGELIFSTTAGALFSYRILWFFTLTLAAKWVLVVTTARSFVLTGVHPLERWRNLPGPRGWLLWVFLLLGVLCFPIWVGFHAGTVGSLLAGITETGKAFHGSAHYLWGVAALGGTLMLAGFGGYETLERVQMGIVGLMLALVLVALWLVKPDWSAMAQGFLVPQALHYPDWIGEYPNIASRPIWVEIVTYVGVLGGSGYDYLAYVSYIRDKQWGRAGRTPLPSVSSRPENSERERAWLKVLYVDATVSFLAVLFFSAVFVACGAAVLAPQHKVPEGSNLLSLQSQFLTGIHPWLGPVYFAGAFLTMLGTLYGTIEVAPAIVREVLPVILPKLRPEPAALRKITVLWVSAGGCLVLLASIVWAMLGHTGTPPGLVELLTPANLFTGVLACGVICLLNPWVERQGLGRSTKMSGLFRALCVLSGLCFLSLGFKAYYDQGWLKAALLFAGTTLAGMAAASLTTPRTRST